MADELSLRVVASYVSAATSGTVKISSSVTQDKSGSVFDINTGTASTTPSQLSISSGTTGYVWIRNKSTTVGQTIHVQTTNTSGVGDHRFATLPINGGTILYPLKASGAVWLQAASGSPAFEYALIGT